MSKTDRIDFLRVLTERKPPIYAKIREYLPDKFPNEHYKMVRDYPDRQGKYLRPVLVLLANEMFGGKESDALLTAAAMQTSEDWILIHDDIEDESDERRDKPCLHKIYGMGRALNAGDALHAIMWKMLFDNVNVLGLEKSRRIFERMENIILYTCEGQYLELSWIFNKRLNVTENEYYQMIDAKAGAYSIYGPMQLGAIIADATDRQLDSIQEFGVPFGRAFMIFDDVLNLTGDRRKYGKEIGGDILEGKRTLILIHLLNHCTPREGEEIVRFYKKKRKQKEKREVGYVLGLMEKYGSIEYAHRIALEFADKAKRLFDKNTATLEVSLAKKIIRSGIDFVVNRDR